MDYDDFLSSPRWQILEIIAKEPSSPLEISEKMQTSVSYISQQLKLLEVANIVVKEKTGLIEKGKPRNLYSISNEILHITALMNKSPFKNIVNLTEHHKLIMKIWLLKDSHSHYYIEKLYWKIEENLKEIKGVFVDISSNKLKILIISDLKKIKTKIESFLKESKENIDCEIISENMLFKIPQENLHTIYDPNFLLNKIELKGGQKRERWNLKEI